MPKLPTPSLTKLSKTPFPTTMIPHPTFPSQKASSFQSSDTDPAYSPLLMKLNLTTILSHSFLDVFHHSHTTAIHNTVPFQTITLLTLLSLSTYYGEVPHTPHACLITFLANNCGYGSLTSHQSSLLATTMNYKTTASPRTSGFPPFAF